MERFVMVAVITICLLWAGLHFLGSHMSIDFDDDGHHVHEVPEALVTAAAGHTAQTFAAQGVDIRHAAARVTLTPEDRTDIAVEVTNPGHAPMPAIALEGTTVVVDGHLRGRVSNCRDDGGARLEGYGDFALADLPQIVIHAPKAVVLAASGDVTTAIGASQSLDATFTGCGGNEIGDVAGPLHLKLIGAGHAHTGAAQGLNLELAGASGVTVGAVTDHADIQSGGAGNITLASLTGSLNAQGGGVGELNINGGQITEAHVEIAGVGNTKINAPVQSLNAVIMGVGNVEVNAPVHDLDAQIMGPGAVRVQSVSGSVRRSVMGPGSVVIEQH